MYSLAFPVHLGGSNPTVVAQGRQWGDLANRPTNLSVDLRPPILATSFVIDTVVQRAPRALALRDAEPQA